MNSIINSSFYGWIIFLLIILILNTYSITAIELEFQSISINDSVTAPITTDSINNTAASIGLIDLITVVLDPIPDDTINIQLSSVVDNTREIESNNTIESISIAESSINNSNHSIATVNHTITVTESQQQHSTVNITSTSAASSSIPVQSQPAASVPIAEKKNPIIAMKETVMKTIESKKKQQKTQQNTDAAAAAAVAAAASADSEHLASAHTEPQVAIDPIKISTVDSTTVPANTKSQSSSTSSTTDKSHTTIPTHSIPIPASINPISTADDNRFNYAAIDAGAKLLLSSPGMKKSNSILLNDPDRYLMVPCSENAKYFIIQLSEDIHIDSIEIANYEHYSSSIAEFQLLGSTIYPNVNDNNDNNWFLLGQFKAEDTNQKQLFKFKNRIDIDSTDIDLINPADNSDSVTPQVRFIKFVWLSHYKEEYYCTLTYLKIYGQTVLEEFRVELEKSEREVQEITQELANTAAAAATKPITIINEQLIEANIDIAVNKENQNSAITNTMDNPTELSQLSTGSTITTESNPALSTTTDTHPAIPETISVTVTATVPVIDTVVIDNIPVIDSESQSQSQHPITATATVNSINEPISIDPIPSESIPEIIPVTIIDPISTIIQSEQSIKSINIDTTTAAIPIIQTNSIVDDSSNSNTNQPQILGPIPTVPAPAAVTASTSTSASASAPVNSDSIVDHQTTVDSSISGSDEIHDLVSAQLARLGAQAGAQSQAQAAATASQIKQLYANQFKGNSATATGSASTATPSTPKPIPTAASTVGSTKSLTTQSIFKALTNRIKELEINQALSTQYVSDLSEQFSSDISTLNSKLTDQSQLFQSHFNSIEQHLIDSFIRLNQTYNRIKDKHLNMQESISSQLIIVQSAVNTVYIAIIVQIIIGLLIGIIYWIISSRNRKRAKNQLIRPIPTTTVTVTAAAVNNKNPIELSQSTINHTDIDTSIANNTIINSNGEFDSKTEFKSTAIAVAAAATAPAPSIVLSTPKSLLNLNRSIISDTVSEFKSPIEAEIESDMVQAEIETETETETDSDNDLNNSIQYPYNNGINSAVIINTVSSCTNSSTASPPSATTAAATAISTTASIVN